MAELVKALGRGSSKVVGAMHGAMMWREVLEAEGQFNSALFYTQLFYFSQSVIPGPQRHPLLFLGPLKSGWCKRVSSMQTSNFFKVLLGYFYQKMFFVVLYLNMDIT